MNTYVYCVDNIEEAAKFANVVIAAGGGIYGMVGVPRKPLGINPNAAHLAIVYQAPKELEMEKKR